MIATLAPRRLAVLALGAALAAGCARFRRHPAPLTPAVALSAGAIAASEWPLARAAAHQAAVGGKFTRADSILRAFSASYPGTESAADALFYRSFYKLDPAVETTAPAENVREARQGLEAYIAGGPMLPHYAEAITLRRIAAHLDSLHVAAAADPVRAPLGVAPTQTVRDTLKMRDDEILRLKADLDQMKSEMERLRRRLTPRP